MVDNHQVAIAIKAQTSKHHHAGVGGVDGRTKPSRDVDAGVNGRRVIVTRKVVVVRRPDESKCAGRAREWPPAGARLTAAAAGSSRLPADDRQLPDRDVTPATGDDDSLAVLD